MDQNAKTAKQKQQKHRTTRNTKSRVEAWKLQVRKAATLKITKLDKVGGMAQRLTPRCTRFIAGPIELKRARLLL